MVCSMPNQRCSMKLPCRPAFTLIELMVVVALVAIGVSLFGFEPEMVRRYAISMALVALFFLWPGSMDALSKRITPLLFGVYLTHPLVVRVYQAAHLPTLPPALLGVIVFCAAALLVEGMRHTPLRRLV